MAAMNSTQGHGLLSGRVAAGGIIALAAVTLALVSQSRATVSASATNLPSCMPPSERHSTSVSRVDDRGILTLQDGRLVKAEALLLPSAQRDNAPNSVQRDALAAIRNLIGRHQVRLHVREPRFDRYRRLRAQISLEDQSGKPLWLQQEIVRRGFARVSILPDRRECAGELYAAEVAARQARAGLWSSEAYEVRTPESLTWRDLGTFQIVQGDAVNATTRGSRAYINFGQDWHRDFTVTIAPDDMKAFRAAGVDPESYGGKTLRVHGWIDRLNGFEIEAASPEQIELVSPGN
jgi:endonuclease YncB( thermonuclease family)